MATIREINVVKNMAREANDRGDQKTLQACIAWLDEEWHDHHAAQCFYTQLEKNSGGTDAR